MTAPQAYYVLTTMGPHNRGDVITFSPQQLGAGINLTRLEALGALRVATTDEATGAMPAQIQVATQAGNYTWNGAPTNGTNGTYATLAPFGATLFDVSQSPPVQYVNTGTQASPTWTQLLFMGNGLQVEYNGAAVPVPADGPATHGVVMDTVYTDPGNRYDLATGAIALTQPGLYLMQFDVQLQADGHGFASVCLYQNATIIDSLATHVFAAAESWAVPTVLQVVFIDPTAGPIALKARNNGPAAVSVQYAMLTMTQVG